MLISSPKKKGNLKLNAYWWGMLIWRMLISRFYCIRHIFTWDMVQSHPHIIAHFLDIRFRLFKEQVLRPFFGYTDEWSRYEWQARGSGHLHCLFWIPSVPPPSMLLRLTPKPKLHWFSPWKYMYRDHNSLIPQRKLSGGPVAVAKPL